MLQNGFPHLQRRAHSDQGHAIRGSQVDRPGDQDDMRAPGGGGLGERVAHFAGRSVRDVPHRVQGFLGRTCRDEDRLALQVPPPVQHRQHRIGDSFSFRHAAGAQHATGQRTFVRANHSVAALAQDLEVCLRCRVVPHVGVHGGRQDHWTGEGEVRGGQEVVRDPVRELRQQIGGRGGDDQQVALLGHADMLDGAGERLVLAGGGEETGDDLGGPSGRRR